MHTRDQLPHHQTAFYVCRGIGLDTESGEVTLPALGPPDWTGKRPYRSEPAGETVYLFDDELGSEAFDSWDALNPAQRAAWLRGMNEQAPE